MTPSQFNEPVSAELLILRRPNLEYGIVKPEGHFDDIILTHSPGRPVVAGKTVLDMISRVVVTVWLIVLFRQRLEYPIRLRAAAETTPQIVETISIHDQLSASW